MRILIACLGLAITLASTAPVMAASSMDGYFGDLTRTAPLLDGYFGELERSGP